MDLGIKGRTALVCAASKGLGKASAESLAEAGVNVTICSRTETDIKKAAEAISDQYKIPIVIGGQAIKNDPDDWTVSLLSRNPGSRTT